MWLLILNNNGSLGVIVTHWMVNGCLYVLEALKLLLFHFFFFNYWWRHLHRLAYLLIDHFSLRTELICHGTIINVLRSLILNLIHIALILMYHLLLRIIEIFHHVALISSNLANPFSEVIETDIILRVELIIILSATQIIH